MDVVITLIVGIPLTFLFSYWLFVFQRRRKKLGYEVLSSSLVIPFESKEGDNLQVIVKAELVHGDSSSFGEEYVLAGKVYGFRVRLRNTGNETIENQDVFLELDDQAKVVSVEIEHAPPGMGGILPRRVTGKPNVGTCRLPFLNEGEEIIISVQSVDNRSTDCKVFAAAPGLRTHDIAAQRRKRLAFLDVGGIAAFVVAVVAVIVGSVIYGPTSAPSTVLADSLRGPCHILDRYIRDGYGEPWMAHHQCVASEGHTKPEAPKAERLNTHYRSKRLPVAVLPEDGEAVQDVAQ